MTSTFGTKGKLDYAAEGMTARDQGKPKDTYPYRPGSTEAWAWTKGWERRDKELATGQGRP